MLNVVKIKRQTEVIKINRQSYVQLELFPPPKIEVPENWDEQIDKLKKSAKTSVCYCEDQQQNKEDCTFRAYCKYHNAEISQD